MPPPIRSTDQIIAELNRNGDGPWIALDGFYALTTAQLAVRVEFIPTTGVILKAFFNDRTGEIRTFAANFVLLPPEQAALLGQGR